MMGRGPFGHQVPLELEGHALGDYFGDYDLLPVLVGLWAVIVVVSPALSHAAAVIKAGDGYYSS